MWLFFVERSAYTKLTAAPIGISCFILAGVISGTVNVFAVYGLNWAEMPQSVALWQQVQGEPAQRAIVFCRLLQSRTVDIGEDLREQLAVLALLDRGLRYGEPIER